MTGNLQWFMKSRDLQVADDVRKKAELGWFDVEFTMYGCAYLEPKEDKLYFKVSSKAEDIYDFIERSAEYDIFPSKVETLTLKCPVPMGTKDLIAQDVKKELAKELQNKYTKEFFEKLYQMAETVQTNQAAELLWGEADAIEGLFEEERLRRFEELVVYTYSCRKIQRAEYEKLKEWIAEERRNMEDGTVGKDLFEKTMYGLVYEEDGRLKYKSDAQQESVYRVYYEKEAAGILVSPVYAQTYWYNYKYRLPNVIDDYKAELQQACNNEYVEKLKAIKGTADAETKANYLAKLGEIAEQYGADCAETAKRYFHRWALL